MRIKPSDTAYYHPISNKNLREIPLIAFFITKSLLKYFLCVGVPAIKYFRSDLREKFRKLFDDDRILVYIYHCNAQLPTGEEAFRTISDCFAWTKGLKVYFNIENSHHCFLFFIIRTNY